MDENVRLRRVSPNNGLCHASTAQETPKDTTLRLVEKIDGTQYIAIILSDDGREVLLDTENLGKILINIKNSKILNKDGILILHRHKKEKEIFSSDFNIIEEKKYGISKIFFITF